jgi:hypothetical protein
MENKDKHFDLIFWYVVSLTAFGMAFSIFCVVWFDQKVSERFADTAHIFWLSTGVAGGIGYLLGSSAPKRTANKHGETTAEISATITQNKEESE